MNPIDSFDRHVSDWLHAEAEHRVPPHLDAVLRRTGSERQRPAWSSLERWLPMESTARFAAVPRLAWVLATVALLVALVATAVFVGSRRPAPSPFGETSRGTVLYAGTDGDIYALDTATNQAHPLIVGPSIDGDPSVSPDGKQVVFDRHEVGGVTTMMLAASDGSNLRPLPGKIQGQVPLAWSPNSDRLAYIGVIGRIDGLWTIGLDGTTTPVLARQPGTAYGTIEDVQWRPNGQELVFQAGTLDTVAPGGIYLVRSDGTGLRPLVEPTSPQPITPALSPDGARVAYSVKTADGVALHVVDIDSGDDTVVAFDDTVDARRPHWSPDGRRLLFERYAGGTFQLAVGSVDGGAVTTIGPVQPANAGVSHARFTPDGSRVQAYYESDGSSWVLDPLAGTAIQLPDDIDSPLSWQGAGS